MLETLLRNNRAHFHPVVPFDWSQEPVYLLDLTEANTDLQTFDLRDTVTFTQYIFGQMASAKARVAVGGYNENRYIYRRSAHFGQQEEARSIHLGIDIWAVAGTPVFAPLDGHVHSFQHNDHFGDYGPTLILEHTLANERFYTLYGHLSLASLDGQHVGQPIKGGQQIAEIGDYPINGDWPPHLHFQVMSDLQDHWGDFPGVCAPSERNHYLSLCPNPNAILGIPQLN